MRHTQTISYGQASSLQLTAPSQHFLSDGSAATAPLVIKSKAAVKPRSLSAVIMIAMENMQTEQIRLTFVKILITIKHGPAP